MNREESPFLGTPSLEYLFPVLLYFIIIYIYIEKGRQINHTIYIYTTARNRVVFSFYPPVWYVIRSYSIHLFRECMHTIIHTFSELVSQTVNVYW